MIFECLWYLLKTYSYCGQLILRQDSFEPFSILTTFCGQLFIGQGSPGKYIFNIKLTMGGKLVVIRIGL